jgi:hypothetical protein
MAGALTSFGILEQEGELRGSSEPKGYVPNRADFDEHIQTYRSFKKIVLTVIALLAVLLAGMAYFLL